MGLFFAIILFFSCTPKVLLRTPGGTRTPGWESLCLRGMLKRVHGIQIMQIGFPPHEQVRTGGKHNTTENDV